MILVRDVFVLENGEVDEVACEIFSVAFLAWMLLELKSFMKAKKVSSGEWGGHTLLIHLNNNGWTNCECMLGNKAKNETMAVAGDRPLHSSSRNRSVAQEGIGATNS